MAKSNQIVVRITKELDKEISISSDKKGLTKASWVRQIIIERLNNDKA